MAKLVDALLSGGSASDGVPVRLWSRAQIRNEEVIRNANHLLIFYFILVYLKFHHLLFFFLKFVSSIFIARQCYLLA